ncbi:hypothetical protein DITRI_Ditri09bG0055400 [Diplodiscus trichospermus]
MGNPHIVVVPYPAQGHVIPLMELSQNLAKQGFKISFINTEFNHKRVLDAFGKKIDENGLIHLVSLPDGLDDGEDRNQFGKLTETLGQVMPRELKEFIEKLIDDGLIDENGTPVNQHMMLQLSPTTPAIHPISFLWLAIDNNDSTAQTFLFRFFKGHNKVVETTDWVLCNSSLELEPEGFTLVPKVLPMGPLSASNLLGNLSGSFWPEDPTCLQWLDKQPPGSVIYVAFGSITIFNQIQFQELALGLELSNRPFLWVVRPDITKGKESVYPEEFQERVGSQGVSNGVPFLCWPYFADQFLNESNICDIWKVGLKFERDGRGIITKEEIKTKIEKLLRDENFKRKAIQLKETVGNSVSEGGSSDKIFKKFIEWMKS